MIGVQYRPYPDRTLGATYTTATDLPLEGGHLTTDFSAKGLGIVTYSDVRLTGLSLPQEVALGLAWQVNKPQLLSFELAWLDWSDALTSSRLTARNPDNPAAPAEIAGVSTLNWRDQYAFALGMGYALDVPTHLLAGYNYGCNPIPAEHTQPLLAASAEQHVTFGVGRRGEGEWRETFAVEFQPGNTVRIPIRNYLSGRARSVTAMWRCTSLLSRRW